MSDRADATHWSLLGPHRNRRLQLRAPGPAAGVSARSALRGRGAGRTRRRAHAELAQAADIPLAFGDWRELVEHPDVDAVAIATPPSLQPEIAIRALELRQAGVRRKADGRRSRRRRAHGAGRRASGRPPWSISISAQILSWRKAKALLDEGAIGRLRHVAVNWNVENYAHAHAAEELEDASATTAAARSAISSATASTISNGSAARSPALSARLSGLPDEPDDGNQRRASAWRFSRARPAASP